MSIKPLPEDVIAQIKSSTTITSLNGVVFELMKNSLDAGSTKIDISVDYSRGGCITEDDGLGILPSEFGDNGGLGKLYHSSKLNSQTPVHGGHGIFLASLSAMSLLSITSHHHLHRSHNTLSMHKTEVVSRQVPAPAVQNLSRFDHGTRVTVRNLFGNMPVRVKQRAIISEKQGTASREWETLKGNLVSLLLAWPSSVALTLRELTNDQKMVVRDPSNSVRIPEISRVCRILSQSSFITPEEKDSWVSVSASTSSLNVSGTISLDPSPTKHIQFISLDIQPLLAVEGQSVLRNEINRLFLNSAFGNEEVGEEIDDIEINWRAVDMRYKGERYTNKELRGGKKGVDRWPMFYINIQRTSSSSISKTFDVDDILDDKANSLSAITDLLQAMIFEFLTRHHFGPKAIRGQRSKILEDDKIGLPILGRRSPQRDRKTVTFEKSPSTQLSSPWASRVEKKKYAKIRSTDSDLLGASVKLPSFRRPSSTPESPFDGWSRMKSGTAKPTLENINEKNLQLSSSLDTQRPSTAPLPSSPPVPKPAPSRTSIPLISSAGKVVRRPFEDIPTPLPRSKSTSLRSLSEDGSALSKSAVPEVTPAHFDLTKYVGNDIVAWINPITKVKSLVNKRTGHTVAAVNTKGAFPLTRSLSSPNLPSRPKLSYPISQTSKPSPWLASLLEKWDNPVFRPTEASIPQLSISGEAEHVLHGHRHNCSQLDIDHAFTEASSGIAGRISKSALKNAEMIGQVDRKFILVKVRTGSKGNKEIGQCQTLVIIDQHAADERIRVENLLAELCTPPAPRLDNPPNDSPILTIVLDKDIVFEVSDKDIELLRTKRHRFGNWGIIYDIPIPNPTKPSITSVRRESKTKQKITVRALPPGIVERCKADPKLLIELIRTELYSTARESSLSLSTTTTNSPELKKPWLTKIHTCPQGILDMLNSRACRSAIMFNDLLSQEQCEILVQRLAETAFPFQCAHGRPSLLPLIELGSVPAEQASTTFDGWAVGGDFRKDFTAWKRSLTTQ